MITNVLLVAENPRLSVFIFLLSNLSSILPCLTFCVLVMFQDTVIGEVNVSPIVSDVLVVLNEAMLGSWYGYNRSLVTSTSGTLSKVLPLVMPPIVVGTCLGSVNKTSPLFNLSISALV